MQAGLNKGEALGRASFMHRLNEIRDLGVGGSALPRHRRWAAITLWNTVYIERTIEPLKQKGVPVNELLVSHPSPLLYKI
nr:Tn3 family transposase [Escherichia coli]